MHEEEIARLKARVRDLEVTLKQNDQTIQTTLRLTPAAANIFGLLMSTALVTPSLIEQRLELATEAKVAMHRLRAQLKPFGIDVQSKRKLGYWLDPETKAKVKAMLAAAEEPASTAPVLEAVPEVMAVAA